MDFFNITENSDNLDGIWDSFTSNNNPIESELLSDSEITATVGNGSNPGPFFMPTPDPNVAHNLKNATNAKIDADLNTCVDPIEPKNAPTVNRDPETESSQPKPLPQIEILSNSQNGDDSQTLSDTASHPPENSNNEFRTPQKNQNAVEEAFEKAINSTKDSDAFLDVDDFEGKQVNPSLVIQTSSIIQTLHDIFPNAIKEDLIAKYKVLFNENWYSIVPSLYEMLQDRSAVFIKNAETGKMEMGFVGPMNEIFKENKTRFCKTFKKRKTYACTDQGCVNCFKKFKDLLLKAFKSDGKTGQVDIVPLNKSGFETGTHIPFDQCHYFKLVLTEKYGGKFSLTNLDFQELSDNIQADFKRNNKPKGKKRKSTEMDNTGNSSKPGNFKVSRVPVQYLTDPQNSENFGYVANPGNTIVTGAATVSAVVHAAPKQDYKALYEQGMQQISNLHKELAQQIKLRQHAEKQAKQEGNIYSLGCFVRTSMVEAFQNGESKPFLSNFPESCGNEYKIVQVQNNPNRSVHERSYNVANQSSFQTSMSSCSPDKIRKMSRQQVYSQTTQNPSYVNRQHTSVHERQVKFVNSQENRNSSF